MVAEARLAGLLAREAPVLTTFTPDAAAGLPGAPWLRARRAAAAEMFTGAPVPTAKDEVWRYSRIDELDLGRFAPARVVAAAGGDGSGPSPSDRLHALVDALGPRAGLVVTIDGVLATVASSVDDADLVLGRTTDLPDGGEVLGSVADAGHDFVLLNDAFAPDPVVVDVAAGATVGLPVVVVHVVTGRPGSAVFPRTALRLGPGSRAGVVELVLAADHGLLATPPGGAVPSAARPPEQLVVPVTEVAVGEGSTLEYVSVQSLTGATWQLAYQASTIGTRASLSSFAVALGGGYARLRTDSALTGDGGTSRLRAAYLGSDHQMLDFRTLQDHRAPRTVSDLLFMGAVADTAHAVYSGLIRVRKGAVKADAVQTNHNLVLDEGAHADSVPNLDIEENDVRCSHGSTVGPVDEDQRYYLESRGVEPSRAERLIVAGFFESIAAQVPLAGARPLVGRALTERVGVSRD